MSKRSFPVIRHFDPFATEPWAIVFLTQWMFEACANIIEVPGLIFQVHRCFQQARSPPVTAPACL
jgi:hypothetical protein